MSASIDFSDNVINVHDLTHFNQITSIAKTKGATLFAIDIQVRVCSVLWDSVSQVTLCDTVDM